MEEKWFERILIIAAIASILVFAFVTIVYAAPTVCQVGNGCTGTSTTPGYGQLLIGGKSGEYEYVASSTFGGGGSGGFSTTSAAYWLTQQTTSGLAEGSNLYFTNARAVSALTGQDVSIFTNDAGYLTPSTFDTDFDTRLSATTSLPSITTLNGLSLPYTQLTGTPSIPTETSQLINNSGFVTSSFSTTSAAYWQSVTNFFSTTSASYFLSQNTGFAFSTTSASYFLSQNQGAAFSTTSANYWGGIQGYLTGNQTITLSGAVSGSGATSITTSYAGTLGNTLGGTGQNSSAWTGLAGISSGTWYAISTSSALNASITGNAGTATTLQTSRTINGISFNGSANIVVASTTLLASDNNTFSGNTMFVASTTMQKQLNLQGASSTLLSAASFWDTAQTSGCAQFSSSGFLSSTGSACGTSGGITALGNYATTTGTTVSLSTSTETTNGVTQGVDIVVSSAAILFTPTISGTLNNGGLTNSTIRLNGVTLTLGDTNDTVNAASSSALGDNNTFSGTDSFTNASSNFSGTWQTFSPSHFQSALTFPLSYSNGGTGTSTPAAYGQVLAWNGTNYQAISTSSLNLTAAAFKSANVSQWTNDAGYITGNQSITLTGAISGSGTTAITTSYAGTLGNTLGGTGQNSSSWSGLAGMSSGVWYAISTSTALNTSITGNAGTVTNGVYTTGAGTVYLTPTGSAASLTSFPTFNQNTTGSAATLTTARTINGVSFNGSANIVVASTTLLSSDNNTFSGNTIFVASTTHEGQVNLVGASSTLFSTGNLWDTALTSGDCVQASTNGLLTTTGSACGSGGGGSITIGNYASSTASSFSFSTSTSVSFQGATFGQNIVVSANSVLFTPTVTGTLTAASSTLLGNNNTFSGNDTFSNLITGSVSGNAGTASALSPGATINGVSFTGASNIVVASTTLLANNNTWSGLNTFGAATSTSFADTALSSSLVLTASDGALENYGGASACSNQFVTAISALGATTCATVGNAALAHSTIVVNSTTLTLGDSGDTLTAASSTLLANNNTFSGNDMLLASTTIGGGAAAIGLTVNGAATTSKNIIVQGTATSSFAGQLLLNSTLGIYDNSGTSTVQDTNGANITNGTHGIYVVPGSSTTTIQFY